MNPDKFKNWALAIGKSEKTVKNYIGAINGSISTWLNDAHITNKNLFEIDDYRQFQILADKAKSLDIFNERDTKGKRMYSAALKCYDEFLSDTTGQILTEDIENIFTDKHLAQTEKTMLISTRIGQGGYRQNLIDYWQGCALTRFKNPRLLVASHIKPWRASDNNERLDVFNGILLLPNLDKAFDLGYITFEEKGKIKISEELENFKALGIEPEMKITFDRRHQDYLDYHRKEIFQ